MHTFHACSQRSADDSDNNASVGTILAYVFYWLLIIATLLYLKWSEGRLVFFGKGSKAHQRRAQRERAAAIANEQAAEKAEKRVPRSAGSQAGSESESGTQSPVSTGAGPELSPSEEKKATFGA